MTWLWVALAAGAALWLVRQIVAWREASELLDGVDARNAAFTSDLVRRLLAVYVHEFKTAHKDTPKGR